LLNEGPVLFKIRIKETMWKKPLFFPYEFLLQTVAV